jgi:mannose PTS system EIIA component
LFAIIVGTHGIFSEELIKTCEMICGETTNVKAITLMPGESPDDVVEKYEAAIRGMNTSDGVIFLNDLFGGTPYNAACRVAINNEMYGIVTGVNLPMLLEMVSVQFAHEEVDIKELMSKATEAGKAGTRMFHASTIQQAAADDLSDE